MRICLTIRKKIVNNYDCAKNDVYSSPPTIATRAAGIGCNGTIDGGGRGSGFESDAERGESSVKFVEKYLPGSLDLDEITIILKSLFPMD